MLDSLLYNGFSYSLPWEVYLCQGKYLFAGFAIIPQSGVIPRTLHPAPRKTACCCNAMTATGGFNHDLLL